MENGILQRLFWKLNLLRASTGKCLLHTMYFYNGKLFGLRSGEHRSLAVNNFEIGANFVKFQENYCKTYHAGFTDLKYILRVVKHVCHPVVGSAVHDHSLGEIFRLYIGLVETNAKNLNAFYFRPSRSKLRFDKVPVGVNSLNEILPQMRKAAGIKRKTSHCLRVTCTFLLFNAHIVEKLIRNMPFLSTRSPAKRKLRKYLQF